MRTIRLGTPAGAEHGRSLCLYHWAGRRSGPPGGQHHPGRGGTIFFRLLTDESRDEFWSQTNDYTDVPADAWYNNAVSTLSNAGIIDGYEDGTFKPDGNITRAEFATIAVRFFEATYDGEDLFSDIAGHWPRITSTRPPMPASWMGIPMAPSGPSSILPGPRP